VEIARRRYEHFQENGGLLQEIVAPDFVWDMSNFSGWTDQQLYERIEGARALLRDWTEVFEFRFEVESLHDAGAKVVAVVRQRGRSQASGMPLDMSFAHYTSQTAIAGASRRAFPLAVGRSASGV